MVHFDAREWPTPWVGGTMISTPVTPSGVVGQRPNASLLSPAADLGEPVTVVLIRDTVDPDTRQGVNGFGYGAKLTLALMRLDSQP